MFGSTYGAGGATYLVLVVRMQVNAALLARLPLLRYTLINIRLMYDLWHPVLLHIQLMHFVPNQKLLHRNSIRLSILKKQCDESAEKVDQIQQDANDDDEEDFRAETHSEG